ncbi:MULTISPECIES: transcriptional regulator [Haloferacaceae]|uniref:Transcriptional regulator n=1 Tax=Halorubrum glutamatedens TaxID=2707018 RepID=A0ABD5QU54_9EURY|nr:transcriptional regulator [Halobellus captivus]
MPDLHPIAKRIHNVQPEPVRLELDSGETGTYEFSSTEFFQREFRGEGVRTDADADAAFRLVTSEDHERVLLGRSGPDEDGWSMLGEVVAAERAGDVSGDDGGPS